MKQLLFYLSLVAVVLLAACSDNTENPDKNSGKEQTATEEQVDNKEVSLPDSVLGKGQKSEEVHQLQQALAVIGYDVKTTGTYDDITTWAITDIQLQLETDELLVTGIYDEGTRAALVDLLEDNTTVTPEKGLTKPIEPDAYPRDVENPYDVLAVVNKAHALPGDYIPEDLAVPDIPFPFEEDDPKRQLRQVAADAIEDMFNATEAEGLELYGQSGYRSYDRQEAIFASNTDQHGEEHANTYSARPGESEHQTGLVMDVTSREVGFDLTTDFGDTEEGKWLADHAHEYGFIIRYPEDKVDITKYQYEPWHLRYVGVNAATEIYENSESLEEYFGVDG